MNRNIRCKIPVTIWVNTWLQMGKNNEFQIPCLHFQQDDALDLEIIM